MDIREIMELLPHRYPMLLIDRVLDLQAGKSCRGLKNVTINEAFFQGHYPGNPIMPGVLIVECMAQTCAVIMLSDPKYKDSVPLLGALDDVRFKRPVVPGDTLVTDVEVMWIRGSIGKIKASAKVGEEIAATMEMTFKIAPKSGAEAKG